jgi:zinc transporter, ZIP family
MPLHDPSAPLAPSPEVREALHLNNGHHHDHKLMRMGLFTALAIGIHNFPEGLATFLAALEDPHLGIAIGIAIALHNIPEGISVSVPIFYATGDRKKAFMYSLLSGLAEPVGAGVAYLILLFIAGGDKAVVPPELMGILFGGVAGIMVYISLDELLPTSRAYGKGHDSLLGAGRRHGRHGTQPVADEVAPWRTLRRSGHYCSSHVSRRSASAAPCSSTC